MSSSQYSNPPSPKSNPFAELFSIITRSDLSSEARLLYSILKLMAWSKGVCWAGIKKQAEYLGRSQDSIRRYHEELEKSKVLLVDRVPGRVNHYYPGSFSPAPTPSPPLTDTPPSPCTGASLTIKKEHTKTFNVGTRITQILSLTEEPLTPQTNVNAIESLSLGKTLSSALPQSYESSSSHEAPTFPDRLTSKPEPSVNADPDYLVEVILETTNDHHSKGAWCRIAREIPEQAVYQALCITREKITTESGINPGKYFIGTIKGLTGFSFKAPAKASSCFNSLSTSQLVPDTDRPFLSIPTPVSDPPKKIVESYPLPSEEIHPEKLIKGWKLLYQTGNVSLVLSVVQRCVSDSDVRTTWDLLRQERQGSDERLIMDEFLELMALKCVKMSNHPANNGGSS